MQPVCVLTGIAIKQLGTTEICGLCGRAHSRDEFHASDLPRGVLDRERVIGQSALVASPEQHSAMEDYLGRVRGVVVALDGYVSASALNRATRLIDHGEPPEALVTLAWAIVNERSQVPRSIVDALCELGEGITDPEHLPANLRDFSA